MEYTKVLRSCKEPAVGAAIISSLNQLFEEDSQLLTINVSEQTIAAKLAQYLQPHFSKFNVDVEYNRMGHIPKKVTWSENLDEVYPDIIVHLRMTEENFLVIELKKDSNPEKKSKDIQKLRAYRRELGYSHALFIRLCTGSNAGKVSECEWVYE